MRDQKEVKTAASIQISVYTREQLQGQKSTRMLRCCVSNTISLMSIILKSKSQSDSHLQQRTACRLSPKPKLPPNRPQARVIYQHTSGPGHQPNVSTSPVYCSAPSGLQTVPTHRRNQTPYPSYRHCPPTLLVVIVSCQTQTERSYSRPSSEHRRHHYHLCTSPAQKTTTKTTTKQKKKKDKCPPFGVRCAYHSHLFVSLTFVAIIYFVPHTYHSRLFVSIIRTDKHVKTLPCPCSLNCHSVLSLP